MGSDFFKTIKIASVYTGIILGAGFASGQELVKFFVGYGFMGAVGLFVSGVIFALVGWAVMDICVKEHIKSYEEFMRKTMGNFLGSLMEATVMFFLLVLLCTMFAASGAAVSQGFGLNYTAGVLIVAVLCFITLLFDAKGIMEINVILVPILVVGGIFIGVYSFAKQPSLNFVNGLADKSWLKGAVVYSSYNIITAITVLCALTQTGINRKVAKHSAILASVCMTLLGFALALALYANYSAANSEIPILSIVSGYGSNIKFLYFVILLAAIFTTAVGNAFALVNYFKTKVKIKSITLKIFFILIAVIFSHIGFSNFVGSVYPIFGYIGLFEIIFVLAYRCKK